MIMLSLCPGMRSYCPLEWALINSTDTVDVREAIPVEATVPSLLSWHWQHRGVCVCVSVCVCRFLLVFSFEVSSLRWVELWGLMSCIWAGCGSFWPNFRPHENAKTLGAVRSKTNRRQRRQTVEGQRISGFIFRSCRVCKNCTFVCRNNS